MPFIDYNAYLFKNLSLLKKQSLNVPFELLVNTYQIHKSLKFTKSLGVGLYHSAVLINEIEIAYGGHNYQGTGVYLSQQFTVPEPALFDSQLKLGLCYKSIDEIIKLITKLSANFLGSQYQIIRYNCNDFTRALVYGLLGQDQLPHYINSPAEFCRKNDITQIVVRKTGVGRLVDNYQMNHDDEVNQQIKGKSRSRQVLVQ